jgi:hypothetical protein
MTFVRMVAGFVIFAILAGGAFYAPVAVAQSVEDATTLTERAIDLKRKAGLPRPNLSTSVLWRRVRGRCKLTTRPSR